MTDTRHSLVRTIYVYLFSLIGLVLIIIATVSFLNMTLKAFVFTQAEIQEDLWQSQPQFAPIAEEKIEGLASDDEAVRSSVTLTEAEQQALKSWLADVEKYNEKQQRINPTVARRQQTASNNVAMLLVGIPLFFYHWRLANRKA